MRGVKNAIPIALLLAALVLLGVALFSDSGNGTEMGALKLDVLELRQENQDLARRLAEAREEIDALSGQISFLETGAIPASSRATPSATELLAASGTKPNAETGTGTTNAGAASGDFLANPPSPAQAAWIESVLQQSMRTQAEEQRKRVLEAQVQFVRSKLDEVAEKMKLPPYQKDQAAQTVETFLRQRSEIRGTRGWWEFTNDEWDAMRARLKETDKSRNDQLAQIFTPEQLQEWKKWEKKRPGWFSPGSSFNPRGSDF